MTPRAVIYARYSTDMQRDASIDDQVRVCRARIAKEGWTLVEVYADAATSGASGFRPNYQAMRQAARDGAFDIVVAEALDRLSRDQEDIAGLYKHLSFAGVRIITLAEGEISEMHIGLKGTMNALFLKDLGAKTRRGLEGGIAAGKSAGGLCYGYSVVRQTDARGELIRGDRAINPAEASVVQRIFQMFAEGSSPIAIAKALNTENVPGPGGRAWRDSTIRGHAARGTGILRNELYVGRLVWDRMHFLKDPQSGKRVSRPNAEAQRKLQPVPELRIVEQDLWDAVQSRHGKISSRVRRRCAGPPALLGPSPRPARAHEQGVLRLLRGSLLRCRQGLPGLHHGTPPGRLRQPAEHQAAGPGRAGAGSAEVRPDGTRAHGGVRRGIRRRMEPPAGRQFGRP